MLAERLDLKFQVVVTIKKSVVGVTNSLEILSQVLVLEFSFTITSLKLTQVKGLILSANNLLIFLSQQLFLKLN